MAGISKSNGTFSVRAHVGDAKTLLAFNIDKAEAQDLAGFTIFCKPKRDEGFYLQNTLQFERPADHAQDTSLPPNSSINAPLHKFRWLHVPGSVHHAENPFYGPYTYTVTPRYFNENGELQPLDRSKSVSVTVNVQPFVKGKLRLGFTRGFTQSQAFVHNFSKNVPLTPKDRDLVPVLSRDMVAATLKTFLDHVNQPNWPHRSLLQRLPPPEVGPDWRKYLADLGITYSAPYADVFPSLAGKIDVVTSTQVLLHIPREPMRWTIGLPHVGHLCSVGSGASRASPFAGFV